MVQAQKRIKEIPGKRDRATATRLFLEKLRKRIITGDPGEAFKRRLFAGMEQIFGEDGSYGVFVRSDTNVEDLPGFTGAGLNLTVPNVVGFQNILAAIARVYASPFGERAYGWRQGRMTDPRHLYCSVLLMKSVPAEKSGVLVTADVDNGRPDWLTLAVNEGVGGAVSGQRAEELRVHMKSGKIRALAPAAEPLKRILLREGGMAKVPASGLRPVLKPEEIQQLITLARQVPRRFPMIRDTRGRQVPADIEFGFVAGRLILFQIRPFLESERAQKSLFLNQLDSRLNNFFSIKPDETDGSGGGNP
jgi:phosphoenolpyruvate synthase/pyruvate phosphate dikinase